MSESLPVIAAIPNYNMAKQLTELLPQLVVQGYADIFVLDDASTDGSREAVDALDSSVHFISNIENTGAGATRNRIIGELGYKAIIHFIDADIDLRSERIPELATDIMPTEPVGFIGGLVKNTQGIQSVWNYGPRQSLRGDLGASILSKIDPLIVENPDKARKIRDRFSSLLEDWPNPLSEPVRRPVFWSIEQNLLIQSEVFEAIGGFDESLREHEIQDLAVRLHQKGLRRYFDPSIIVQHKDIPDVRNYDRRKEQLKTELRIARKHGIKNWVFPEGKFKASL